MSSEILKVAADLAMMGCSDPDQPISKAECTRLANRLKKAWDAQQPPYQPSAPVWQKWFSNQTPLDQWVIATSAIERLIEIDAVRFRPASKDPDDGPSCLYWESCGESLSVPF